MQHVEEAGVHSGDSACVIPAMSLGEEMLRQVEQATEALAPRLGVVGLINIQFAVRGDDELYVIEANPRASRTVPFVSKAIGVPLAKVACRLMLGERLEDIDLELPAPQRTTWRQGGGAAVRPLPAGRLAARPRDEVDRRGDGRGPRLSRRLRQGPGRGGGAAARERDGVHLGDRRRQAGGHPARRRRCTTSGSRCSPPAAPPRRSGGWASRWSGS